MIRLIYTAARVNYSKCSGLNKVAVIYLFQKRLEMPHRLLNPQVLLMRAKMNFWEYGQTSRGTWRAQMRVKDTNLRAGVPPLTPPLNLFYFRYPMAPPPPQVTESTPGLLARGGYVLQVGVYKLDFSDRYYQFRIHHVRLSVSFQFLCFYYCWGE